jgi:hypothetical protein
MMTEWKQQKWMDDDRPERWDTHDEVMKLILGAASVTTLSYDEVVAIYLRGRGIVQDDAEYMGEPLPEHFKASA